MNIKFPFFSCGQQSAHIPKCGLLYPEERRGRQAKYQRENLF
jgi:hypothetical protein